MTRQTLRRFAVAMFIAAALVVIDQLTKAAAISGLSMTDRIPLIGDLLGLQLAFNPGAALSFGADVTWLITPIGLLMTIALIVAALRARSTAAAVGLGFIVGGAIGNLIDRLFAAPGFGIGWVTDFLAYGNLFIGNLADVFIGVGVVVLGVVYIARWRAERQENETTPAEDGAPA